jgi:ABC-type dipeptide/oligopeptide/nickel transport system ATPase component
LTKDGQPLLEISDLSVVFRGQRVLEKLNLEVGAGEIVGLLGESGAGKTVTALAILGLLPAYARIPSGEIRYQGRSLLEIPRKKLREIRGCEIGMIFQDPRAALNPVMRIDQQLCEGMIYRLAYSKQKALNEGSRLLEAVGIRDPSRCLNSYPHQLSGGMRQRVIIASALSCRPQLLICDEITSSIDSLLQSRILSLLGRLKHEMKISILLITHNLRVVRQIADRTAVMLGGKIIEEGETEKILKEPTQEFTRSLAATLSNG